MFSFSVSTIFSIHYPIYFDSSLFKRHYKNKFGTESETFNLLVRNKNECLLSFLLREKKRGEEKGKVLTSKI